MENTEQINKEQIDNFNKSFDDIEKLITSKSKEISKRIIDNIETDLKKDNIKKNTPEYYEQIKSIIEKNNYIPAPYYQEFNYETLYNTIMCLKEYCFTTEDAKIGTDNVLFQYLFEKIDNLYKYEEKQLHIKKNNEEYKANNETHIETLQDRLSKIKTLLDTLPTPKIKKISEALKIQKKEPMKVKKMMPKMLFEKKTKDCNCIFENKKTKEKHLYYALNDFSGTREYLKIPIINNKLVTENAIIEGWENNKVVERYQLNDYSNMQLYNDTTLNLETLKDKSIEIIK